MARAYPNLITTTKVGEPTTQDTWVHERLPLKLAAWVFPRFKVCVHDNIFQIMKNNSVIFSGKEKAIFAWFITEISNNVNEISILLNDIPRQLPENKTVFFSNDENE